MNVNIEELDERVKTLYNACWKSFRQYTNDYDIEAYAERCQQLLVQNKDSILMSSVCEGINWELAKVVNAMHEKHQERIGRNA
jgi:hypothetical protein|nr:MAG TPA: hypothetical protein [Caudoviricetes sp.]